MIVLAFLIPFGGLVFFYDVRLRLIPQWLTAGGFLAAMSLAWFDGRFADALAGAGIAFAVTFILWLLGGMGGGDVKAAAVFGAMAGFPDVFHLLLLSSLIGVLWGLLQKGGTKAVMDMASGLWCGLRIGSLRAMLETQRKLPEDPKCPAAFATVPFGACMALAALVTVWF